MEELNKIVDIITSIKNELDSFIELNDNLKLSKELYNNVLDNISNNLSNFEILDDKLLEYNSLYKSHIDIINYKLQIIKLDINEIKNLYEKSKEGFCKFLCAGKGVKFTELNDKINNSFKEILPILKDVNELQHTVLGESIRINNKLFKYGWLLSGKNDINGSKIDETVFKNNLFLKYKEELKEELQGNNYFNPDSKTIEAYIQSRDLLDKGIEILEGDFFSYGPTFFEVIKAPRSEVIFGQIEHKRFITITGKQARKGQFLSKVFGPTSEKHSDEDAVQDTFIQQRGFKYNENGETGDVRELRKRGVLDDPISGPKEVSPKGDSTGVGSSFYDED